MDEHLDDVPTIVVTRDGPYRVEGRIPLARTSIVRSERDEPIDWDEGPSFKDRRTYELCRCGQSSRKPYCDATHEQIPFDGTETAERGPSAERRAVLEGESLTLTDEVPLCSRAGFCSDNVTDVWEMLESSGEPGMKERIVARVGRCPSGRLVVHEPGDPEAIEPQLEPSIGVVPNGPYWVRGRVRIVSEDGTQWEIRNRVTLCRCGDSANKPFCDGTHKEVGFADPAEPTDRSPASR